MVKIKNERIMKLIENSYNHRTQPTPADIRRFLDKIDVHGIEKTFIFAAYKNFT